MSSRKTFRAGRPGGWATLAAGGLLAACGGPLDPQASAPATDSPASRSQPTVREETFEAEPGLRLFCRIVGEGPRIVLLPGSLFFADDLDTLATAQAGGEDRTLVFYDMRNRGRSDAVDLDRVGIEQDVADLEAVRRHVGAEQVDLVGFSYLGMMVARYAVNNPERVRRLVQLGPAPPRAGAPYQQAAAAAWAEAVDGEAMARLQEQLTAGRSEEDPEGFYRDYWEAITPGLFGDLSRMEAYEVPPPVENEWIHRVNAHFERLFRSFGTYDLRPAAAEFGKPVLVIHGTLDRNAPYEGGREWAAAFPDARLLTLEGAAHLGHVEQKERVLAAIDQFLSGEWPPDAAAPGATAPEEPR